MNQSRSMSGAGFMSAIVCVVSLTVVGCGEFGGGASVIPEVVVLPADLSGDSAAVSDTGTPDGTGSVATTSSGGVGTFKGKVVLTGDLASLKLPLALLHGKGAAVKDAASCSREDVPDEKLVVATENGNGVANVFVYLARAPKGVNPPAAPTEPIVYDQISCRFIPHCVVVTTGRAVSVVNADKVPHNAHTYPGKQTGVNGVVSAEDRVGLEITYQRSESVPLKVACDFHTWMVGYHLPLDHPFAAVTDENGEFQIPDLPAGDYEFVIWHESAGYVHRKFPVTVTSGEPELKTVDFPADLLSL